MLASMRSIRAWRFLTPSSVRGGKYSRETWARPSGSLLRRSMIFGSAVGVAVAEHMVDIETCVG